MATPIDRLKARIASGELSPDADQERAAVALGELRARLAKWKPGKRGLFAKPKPAPKGLYLWGGVGRGKSMLMDLFYDDAPVQPKRRAPFRDFSP